VSSFAQLQPLAWLAYKLEQDDMHRYLTVLFVGAALTGSGIRDLFQVDNSNLDARPYLHYGRRLCLHLLQSLNCAPLNTVRNVAGCTYQTLATVSMPLRMAELNFIDTF